MFLLNGEILNKRDHSDEWKWMESKISEIKGEKKKTYIFKAYNKPTYQKDENGTRIKTPRRRFISAQTSFINEEMGDVGQTWAYTPHMNGIKGERGNQKISRMGLMMDQINTLDVVHDIELIFYLRYISQNKHIQEVDKAKEARARAAKEASHSEARALIYSTKSAIHPNAIGSDAVIRNIASSWGISNLDSLTTEQIQNHLWDRVQASQHRYNETKRGYDEFISEALKMGDGSKRTTIMMGIQKGVLNFNTDQNLWYVRTKGGAEQAIIPVMPGSESQRDEILIKHLVNSDTVYELVELAVNNGNGKVLTENDGISVTDLRRQAKTELGYPQIVVNNKSKEELQEIIANNVEYVKKG